MDNKKELRQTSFIKMLLLSHFSIFFPSLQPMASPISPLFLVLPPPSHPSSSSSFPYSILFFFFLLFFFLLFFPIIVAEEEGKFNSFYSFFLLLLQISKFRVKSTLKNLIKSWFANYCQKPQSNTKLKSQGTSKIVLQFQPLDLILIKEV